MIELQSKEDKVIDFIIPDSDERKHIRELLQDDTPLIFPVCGKRCYNTVVDSRVKPTVDSRVNTCPQNWHKDGDENKKSSIDVLINWLTIEENASLYFGGVDNDGRTNAIRKEGYHLRLKKLIEEENGK